MKLILALNFFTNSKNLEIVIDAVADISKILILILNDIESFKKFSKILILILNTFCTFQKS